VVRLTPGIEVPDETIVFKASRSAGPGGQNVNKVNTRVTVFFDVAGCESLSDDQKKRILRRLATRIDKKGVLRVVCQKFRTQKANRAGALERLAELLGAALARPPVRKRTRIPERARRRRLEEKRRRGALKRLRAERDFEY